jgi:hypothetical protein
MVQQDLPGGGALLERILQLNISAAALQQQQQQQQGVAAAPGAMFPDLTKSPLGAALPPPAGYPPFLYYSYYAQMLHAAQAAWQTQQAVLSGARAGHHQHGNGDAVTKDFHHRNGAADSRRVPNDPSPTSSPMKDRPLEVGTKTKMNK